MAGALALSACGDDDSGTGQRLGENAGSGVAKPRYPYPRETVSRFVAECARTGSRSACVCTIERLQRTLPYEAFSAADRAIRADQPVSANTRATFDAAAEACRE